MNEQIKELSQNELERKVDYIFSHRFNHTLHVYIDIAGDLTAGVLLSQIMYWFDKDSKNERVRTKIKKNGYFWIARRRDEWANEITAKVYFCFLLCLDSIIFHCITSLYNVNLLI